MTSSTLLVYVQWTGHVLAAATVAAPPGQDIQPAALAGLQLPVRYIGGSSSPDVEVCVPAEELAVLPVDSQAVKIDSALSMEVRPDRSVAALGSVPLASSFVKFTANNTLTVTFPSPSTDKALVWARVQPQLVSNLGQLADGSRTAHGEDPGTGTVNLTMQPPLPHSVPYSILVLVSGFPPLLFTLTTP
ncbi:hypothetical protein LMG28614_00731 [Paraburkholderia ultramafica]|uniref:Uncharacterized protein n=1 Tax=Paraburkholderia ultramafica TaxID=1544867 RepID=A0A6S7AXJ9_9BURK|nr:hypothetical protein LMG28614_00731 [Paraburkholderia ultramafica]